MVTKEKRSPNLRRNKGTKPTKIDANIELIAITLQHHNEEEVRGLIKVDLRKWDLQATEVSLKREIALLVGEKGLKDLYYTFDVLLIGMHHLKGFLEGVCLLDVDKRLGKTLLDAMKHSSNNGRVWLWPGGISQVVKRRRVVCEMMKKNVRLKKVLKTRSLDHVIMFAEIVGRLSKLCRDQKEKCGSWRSRKHYREENQWSVGLRCQDI